MKLLDREFFRKHHRLAAWFARRITRRRGWKLAWLLGLFARCTPRPNHTMLETSTSRLHEREDDLQAASDKLGGNLFETTVRLTVHVPATMKSIAIERRDFSLYVDEFQNFTTGSFASVLSEAGKYRLSLIVAHQYLTQLDEPTANAVFGNVGLSATELIG